MLEQSYGVFVLESLLNSTFIIMAYKRYECVELEFFLERLPIRQNEGLMPQLLRPERERIFFYSFVLNDILACIAIKLVRS